LGWIVYLSEKGLKVEFPAGEGIFEIIRQVCPNKKNLLIIEGASSTGQTPSKFQSEFEKYLNDFDYKFAVLYKNPSSSFNIDFVGKIGPEKWPEKFPWHERKAYRPYLRNIFS
jgi:hypothetical protein